MGKPTLFPAIRGREDKRWDWTSNPVTPDGRATVCSRVECGRMFSEPIELTVRAVGSLETYHACPHCFSRLSTSDTQKKTISEARSAASEETASNVTEKRVNCAHSIGYLKTRPKDSPIPDECLTCSQILKCM